jgi:hypothetical protein
VSIYYKPVALFKEAGMVAIPEAAEMGCDPDFCAYTGEQHNGPDAVAMEQQRVASGHVHIGGVEDYDREHQQTLIRWLDILVGIDIADHECNHDRKAYVRRKYYGQAGRFRPKPYGVEYRTPSNMWVHTILEYHGDKPFDQDNIILAVDLTDAGYTPEQFGFDPNHTQQAINGPMRHKDGWQEDWMDVIWRWRGNFRNTVHDVRNIDVQAEPNQG